MGFLGKARGLVAAARGVCDAPIIRLADGARVRLRAAGSAGQDDDAFRRFFFTLSDSTRYLYFCAGVPSTDTWAERMVALTHADGRWSYVLAAEVNDMLIGFARFGQDPRLVPHAADFGIILTDTWQRRGLGGIMLCRLADEARRRAVVRFDGVALWENRRVLRLIRRIFPDVSMDCASGACELSVDL